MTIETTTGHSAVQPAAGASIRRQGLTGRGVGIAIIDSGVTAPGEFGRRLVAGPDFTVDAGTVDEARDHTGHGTHLAGIAAGDQVGVAPGSHVISLKTAGAGGATDVNAIIAAIDWTVAHRHQLSIGVLLLAFGADQLPAGQFDPLAGAVARAWRAGIVVVTSSGNGGEEGPLSTPTHIDEIVTVAGAEQIDGQWLLCDFSDRGEDGCRPDLAAPARSIVGPVAPDSEAAAAPETSFVADGFVKGSGTSQAAAVVAGAAALLLEADPSLTPDELKHVLTVSASRMDEAGAGAGAVDLDVAFACLASGLFRTEPVPATAGAWSGLEWAGHAWRGHAWRGHAWRGHAWRGLEWAGLEWAGHAWRGHAWRGHAWRGLEWAGLEWAGHAWRGHAWRGHAWRGLEWAGLEWAGHAWRGHAWRGLEWAGLEWAGHAWRGHAWRGHAWRGLEWAGLEWAGHAWRGHAWRGLEWAGLEWAGHAWRGHAWRGHAWRGLEWAGLEWAGHAWRGHAWRGLEWAGHAWRGHAWRGLEWA